MSKKIYTVQSSDKKKFDDQINTLLEIGCELLENTYKVIENDDCVIFSHIVEYDSTNIIIDLYDDGQLDFVQNKNEDGKQDGLSIGWYETGEKYFEGIYKDGIKDGLWTWWYKNGQKNEEITYKDGDDRLTTRWYETGEKKFEGIYKDGEYIELHTYWYDDGQKKKEIIYNEDGKKISVKEWDVWGDLIENKDE